MTSPPLWRPPLTICSWLHTACGTWLSTRPECEDEFTPRRALARGDDDCLAARGVPDRVRRRASKRRPSVATDHGLQGLEPAAHGPNVFAGATRLRARH